MTRRKAGILLLCAAAAVEAVAAGPAAADSTAGQSNLLERLNRFNDRMLERVAENQNPTAGSKARIIFTTPPLGSVPEYGFGLGVGAALVFKTDYDAPLLYTSKVPLTARLGLTDPFSYTVMCSPVIYFNQNKLKVAAELSYRQANEYYFGIGYSTNRRQERALSLTGYQSRRVEFSPEVQWRVCDAGVYMGFVGDLIYDRMSRPGTFLTQDAEYIASGGDADGLTMTDVGVGVDVAYDTRDDAKGAFRGVYVGLRGVVYGKWIGSDHNYGRVWLDYRQYVPVGGPRSVLSWGVSSSNAAGGDTPWARYATVGDLYYTRGYYSYQYRDRSVLKAHVEFRYMFNFATEAGRQLLNRFGVACWTGLAALGPNPLRYEGVLPELGAGLRLKINYRLNFHLDFGYDAHDHCARRYFGLTETF